MQLRASTGHFSIVQGLRESTKYVHVFSLRNVNTTVEKIVFKFSTKITIHASEAIYRHVCKFSRKRLASAMLIQVFFSYTVNRRRIKASISTVLALSDSPFSNLCASPSSTSCLVVSKVLVDNREKSLRSELVFEAMFPFLMCSSSTDQCQTTARAYA